MVPRAEAGSRAWELGAAMVTLASSSRGKWTHEGSLSHGGCLLLVHRETDVIPQRVQHCDRLALASGQHLCQEVVL